MEKLGSEEARVTRPPPAPNLPFYAKPDRNIGTGRSGRRIRLSIGTPDAVFFQVLIKSHDKQAMVGKGVGSNVIDKMFQVFSSETKMALKNIAREGEKALYTRGEVPQKNFM